MSGGRRILPHWLSLNALYVSIGRLLRRHPLGERIVRHIECHPRIYGTLEAFAVAGILALFIRAYVVEAYKIPSQSMVPTLKIGDRLFVNKFIYRFREPRIGDVIVFRVPDRIYTKERPIYVKRIVGLPGDRVEIDEEGFLHVNGKRVVSPPFFASHPYSRFVPTGANSPPKEFKGATVPEDQVLVFGDNSLNSFDGRVWGGVPIENIKGHAMFRWWPPSRIGPIE
jgi:signal peptidase I